jgi:hypothetical protein
MSITMPTDESQNPYAVGEPHPNQKRYATLETKPSVHGYTGGGYEHWRSVETRPHTPNTGSEDVYASHHRLLAVVACYPPEEPIEEILADLHSMDVHHASGVPWDNRPSNLETKPHGEHSEITQTQRLAWAHDAKRSVERSEQQPRADRDESGVCDRCGRRDGPLADCPSWPDERRCLDCATETADGEKIQL